jgi:hypothetical protein
MRSDRLSRPNAGAQRRRMAFALLVPALAIGAAVQAEVPSGGGYELRKQVVAFGGGRSSGGNYTLTATVAQPSTRTLTAGSFVLQQGFHAAADVAPSPLLFKDNFE